MSFIWCRINLWNTKGNQIFTMETTQHIQCLKCFAGKTGIAAHKHWILVAPSKSFKTHFHPHCDASAGHPDLNALSWYHVIDLILQLLALSSSSMGVPNKVTSECMLTTKTVLHRNAKCCWCNLENSLFITQFVHQRVHPYVALFNHNVSHKAFTQQIPINSNHRHHLKLFLLSLK